MDEFENPDEIRVYKENNHDSDVESDEIRDGGSTVDTQEMEKVMEVSLRGRRLVRVKEGMEDYFTSKRCRRLELSRQQQPWSLAQTVWSSLARSIKASSSVVGGAGRWGCRVSGGGVEWGGGWRGGWRWGWVEGWFDVVGCGVGGCAVAGGRSSLGNGTNGGDLGSGAFELFWGRVSGADNRVWGVEGRWRGLAIIGVCDREEFEGLGCTGEAEA
ncbi:hypothetical protein Tco_0445777 [Tanacetum coccineum]